MRERVADALSSLDLPQGRARAARGALASGRRFADGSAWRVEIPSVEGPEAMRAVMAESAKRTVPVHRVSQGSGTALLTDAELGEMADLGRASGYEVVLWAGLRAAWDISAMARSSSGATGSAAVRGAPPPCVTTRSKR